MPLERTQRSILRFSDRSCGKQLRSDSPRWQVTSSGFDQGGKGEVAIREGQFLRRTTSINEFWVRVPELQNSLRMKALKIDHSQ